MNQHDPSQVLHQLAGQLVDVGALIEGVPNRVQSLSQLSCGQESRQIGHRACGSGSQDDPRLGHRDLFVAIDSQLVQQADSISQAACRGAGYELQNRRLDLETLLGDDVAQVGDGRLEGDPPKVEALATTQYGLGELVRLGGSQNEDGMGWRLLQGLEQGVERGRSEHMNLVYHVDLVAAFGGNETDLLSQLADLVDSAVGCGVDLDQIQCAALIDGLTHGAFAAGPLGLVGEAVHGLGQDARHAGLAGASRPGEEVGVAHPIPEHSVPQGADHMILADQLVEVLGPPLAV